MRRMWLAMLASALVLAACGGGGATVKPNDAALKRGLLAPGEMGGMEVAPAPTVRSAAGWASQGTPPGTTVRAETARLRRIGFVAGVSEQMSSPTNSNRFGLTLVEQFKSPKGPASELANTLATTGAFTSFKVPGIPAARGFEQDGSQGGRNIAFAHGDYYYLIGSGWQSGASNGVSRAQMIAVAQRLYHRVAG